MYIIPAASRSAYPNTSLPSEHAPCSHVPLATRFGKRFRLLRKQRGLTQQQLSERFGIDRCYISEIENGRRSITLHILEVIADGFKMSLPELLSHLD